MSPVSESARTVAGRDVSAAKMSDLTRRVGAPGRVGTDSAGPEGGN
jgi:hypothetical protein